MQLYVNFGRWDIFLLVLARVAAVVGVAPVLGTRSIPSQVKVGLAVVLTLLLAPMHMPQAGAVPDWITLGLEMSSEVAIGLLMGFAGALVFSAVQIASRLIGVQIGLGMPGTIDPLWSESASFLDTFYGMLAMVIFLNIGGHRIIISALSQSFDLVPVGTYTLSPLAGNNLVALSAAALNTAVHLSIAAVGTMLLTNLAMGLVVRTMPQLNIFSVGMTAQVVVGLLLLSVLMPWTLVGMADLGQSVGSGMAAMLPQAGR